jgi:serine/threonine protein kinase
VAIEAGQQLSHYRLIEKIGEGGMGVVWKARDTTLDREVAIKTLPDVLERHPERLERFEREAKVLASLQHPNIAVVHGLHHVHGVRFLAMELVDGEDLSQRLARGPLPVAEAMKVCVQVAAALQRAHERGVIHRDLKPANIILTAAGEAKVLDFGLAKVLNPDGESEGGPAAPTVTTGGTVAGVVLGTAAYMSPEQARGQPTDRRTDVWSFGCVLHECLTGKAPFRRDTTSDSIGAVLNSLPDWGALPAALPPTIGWVLRRCLAKDRDQRLHDIADARIELEQVIADPDGARLGLHPVDDGEEKAGIRSSAPVLWTLALAALFLAFAAGWLVKPASEQPAGLRGPVQLSLSVPGHQRFDQLQFDISPDGSKVVFVATPVSAEDASEGPPMQRLWLRPLDSPVATPIPGTERASFPRFSPDGRAVAFLLDNQDDASHQADLRVVHLDGRPPRTLSTASVDHGLPFWSSDDTILFVTHENERRILEVALGGGEPQIFAEFDPEIPFWVWSFGTVAGGRWVFSFANDAERGGEAYTVLVSPDGSRVVELLRDAVPQRFLPDGRLLFVRNKELLVTRVDLSADPPRVVGGVHTVLTTPDDAGFQQVAASENGRLAWIPALPDDRRLMTIDARGQVTPLIEASGSFFHPDDVSRDGSELAVTRFSTDSAHDCWLVDLDTGALRPMSSEWNTFCGTWTDDDRLVMSVWRSTEDGTLIVREMSRDAAPIPLFSDWPEDLKLADPVFDVDDQYIAFVVREPKGERRDIYIRRLDGSKRARPLINTRAVEINPAFSPDGRFLAFVSDESGTSEVYVTARDAAGGVIGPVVRASRGGGNRPRWGPGGKLYYSDKNVATVSVVRVQQGARPIVSPPEVLIADTNALRVSTGFAPPFVLPLPDGERLAFVQHPSAFGPDRIEIVLDWEATLDRR